MRVMVVSDTHGRDANFDRAIELAGPIDYLIHCGDVERRDAYIRSMTKGPCCIVAGNCDSYGDLPPIVEFDLCGHHILVVHGHRQGVGHGHEGILRAARLHEADLVCFGHTHVPVLEKEEGIFLCNPGSLTYPRQAGREPSFAILEISADGIRGEINYINY